LYWWTHPRRELRGTGGWERSKFARSCTSLVSLLFTSKHFDDTEHPFDCLNQLRSQKIRIRRLFRSFSPSLFFQLQLQLRITDDSSRAPHGTGKLETNSNTRLRQVSNSSRGSVLHSFFLNSQGKHLFLSDLRWLNTDTGYLYRCHRQLDQARSRFESKETRRSKAENGRKRSTCTPRRWTPITFLIGSTRSISLPCTRIEPPLM